MRDLQSRGTNNSNFELLGAFSHIMATCGIAVGCVVPEGPRPRDRVLAGEPRPGQHSQG